MTSKLLWIAFVPLVYGRQAAVVDLSPKTNPSQPYPTYSRHVRGGGMLSQSPKSPAPSPLRLAIRKIIPTQVGILLRYNAELVVTNEGAAPIWIPIGIDADSLLAPPQHDRTALVFTAAFAQSGKGLAQAGATAASNSEHPDSSAKLQQGDSVLFLIPLGMWPAGSIPSDHIIVSMQSERTVEDGGIDWEEFIGPKLPSQHAVPLPPAPAVPAERE